MNRFLKIALVIVILAGLVGAYASPALANEKLTGHFEFPAYFESTCPNGDTLVWEDYFSGDWTAWFTDAGENFRAEEQFTLTNKIYLKDRPENFLNTENEHWKNLYAKGAAMSVGIVGKITVPGHGIVFHDIGAVKLVWDTGIGYWVPVFFAGEHQDLQGDYAGLCDYLSSLP